MVPALGRLVVFLWLVVLAGCGGDAPPAPESDPAAGSYLLEGSSTDFLHLADDGTFCVRQEGVTVGGTFVADADGTITLTPDLQTLPPEVGRLEDGVVTDPDGDRWVRTEEARTCEADPTASASVAPLSFDGTSIADAVEASGLPASFVEATALLKSLPDELSGYARSSVSQEPGEPRTIALAYPDPDYVGAQSGLTILAVEVPVGAASVQMVDGAAHLQLELADEIERLGPKDRVPFVVGRIVATETDGPLSEEHPAFLAVWSPSRSASVIYGVIADSSDALATTIGALVAAT